MPFSPPPLSSITKIFIFLLSFVEKADVHFYVQSKTVVQRWKELPRVRPSSSSHPTPNPASLEIETSSQETSSAQGMTILPSTSLVDATSQGEPTSTPYASQTFQWGENMNGDPSPTSGSFYFPPMPTNDATTPASEDTGLNNEVSLQRAPASSDAAYLPTMEEHHREEPL